MPLPNERAASSADCRRTSARPPRTLDEVYAEAGVPLALPAAGEKRAAKRSRAALTRMRNEIN